MQTSSSFLTKNNSLSSNTPSVAPSMQETKSLKDQIEILKKRMNAYLLKIVPKCKEEEIASRLTALEEEIKKLKKESEQDGNKRANKIQKLEQNIETLKNAQKISDEIKRLQSEISEQKESKRLTVDQLESQLKQKIEEHSDDDHLFNSLNVENFEQEIQEREDHLKELELTSQDEDDEETLETLRHSILERQTSLKHIKEEIKPLYDQLEAQKKSEIKHTTVNKNDSIDNNDLLTTEFKDEKISTVAVKVQTFEQKFTMHDENLLLDEIQDINDKLPTCSEKSVSLIHCYLQLKQQGKEKINIIKNKKETEINIYEAINKEFMNLQSLFQLEGYEHLAEEIANLEKLLGLKSEDELQEAIKKITNLLVKEFRPFNIRKLQKLANETDEMAKGIRDKKVVAFFGRTGSGKSTTIHYLMGSKIEKVIAKKNEKSAGKDHYAPVKGGKELVNITTSPFGSETQCINTVPYNEEILLCDTPGFADTGGHEIDIANGRAVMKALMGCQQVKPVLLISQYFAGDRMDGYKNLADTLASMIAKPEDFELSIVTTIPKTLQCNTYYLYYSSQTSQWTLVYARNDGALIPVTLNQGMKELLKSFSSAAEITEELSSKIKEKIVAYRKTINPMQQFSYIYTKYETRNTDQERNIKGSLEEAESDPQNHQNENFLALLNCMKKKLGSEKIKIINPEHLMAEKKQEIDSYFKGVCASGWITSPAECLKPFIPVEASNTLTLQVTKHIKVIENVLNKPKPNFYLINYKLDELNGLVEILEDKAIKGKYDAVFNKVITRLNEEFKECSESLNNILEDDFSLTRTVDNLKVYKEKIDWVRSTKDIRALIFEKANLNQESKKFNNENKGLYQDYTNDLLKKVKEMTASIQTELQKLPLKEAKHVKEADQKKTTPSTILDSKEIDDFSDFHVKERFKNDVLITFGRIKKLKLLTEQFLQKDAPYTFYSELQNAYDLSCEDMTKTFYLAIDQSKLVMQSELQSGNCEKLSLSMEMVFILLQQFKEFFKDYSKAEQDYVSFKNYFLNDMLKKRVDISISLLKKIEETSRINEIKKDYSDDIDNCLEILETMPIKFQEFLTEDDIKILIQTKENLVTQITGLFKKLNEAVISKLGAEQKSYQKNQQVEFQKSSVSEIQLLMQKMNLIYGASKIVKPLVIEGYQTTLGSFERYINLLIENIGTRLKTFLNNRDDCEELSQYLTHIKNLQWIDDLKIDALNNENSPRLCKEALQTASNKVIQYASKWQKDIEAIYFNLESDVNLKSAYQIVSSIRLMMPLEKEQVIPDLGKYRTGIQNTFNSNLANNFNKIRDEFKLTKQESKESGYLDEQQECIKKLTFLQETKAAYQNFIKQQTKKPIDILQSVSKDYKNITTLKKDISITDNYLKKLSVKDQKLRESKDKEVQKKANEKEVKSLQEKLERLIKAETDYGVAVQVVQEFWDKVKQKQETFNIGNIDELDAAIAETTQQSYELKVYSYLMSKLNFSRLEKVFNYVLTCKKVCEFGQEDEFSKKVIKDVQDIYKELASFISQWFVFFKKQYESCTQYTKSSEHNNKFKSLHVDELNTSLTTEIKKLKSCLDKLFEINKNSNKYPVLKEHFSNDSGCRDWDSIQLLLEENYKEIEKEINRNTISERHLIVLRCWSVMDCYQPEKCKYDVLYEKKWNEFKGNQEKGQLKQEMLNNLQYGEIKNIMDQLEEDSIIGDNQEKSQLAYNQNRRLLSQHIKKLIENASLRLIGLGEKFDVNTLSSIATDLDHLDTARNCKKHFDDEVESLFDEMWEQQLPNSLTEVINALIKNIEVLSRAFDYINTKKKIIFAKAVNTRLGKYIKEDIDLAKRIKNLGDNLEKGLETIGGEYFENYHVELSYCDKPTDQSIKLGVLYLYLTFKEDYFRLCSQQPEEKSLELDKIYLFLDAKKEFIKFSMKTGRTNIHSVIDQKKIDNKFFLKLKKALEEKNNNSQINWKERFNSNDEQILCAYLKEQGYSLERVLEYAVRNSQDGIIRSRIEKDELRIQLGKYGADIETILNDSSKTKRLNEEQIEAIFSLASVSKTLQPRLSLNKLKRKPPKEIIQNLNKQIEQDKNQTENYQEAVEKLKNKITQGLRQLLLNIESLLNQDKPNGEVADFQKIEIANKDWKLYQDIKKECVPSYIPEEWVKDEFMILEEKRIKAALSNYEQECNKKLVEEEENLKRILGHIHNQSNKVVITQMYAIISDRVSNHSKKIFDLLNLELSSSTQDHAETLQNELTAMLRYWPTRHISEVNNLFMLTQLNLSNKFASHLKYFITHFGVDNNKKKFFESVEQSFILVTTLIKVLKKFENKFFDEIKGSSVKDQKEVKHTENKHEETQRSLDFFQKMEHDLYLSNSSPETLNVEKYKDSYVLFNKKELYYISPVKKELEEVTLTDFNKFWQGISRITPDKLGKIRLKEREIIELIVLNGGHIKGILPIQLREFDTSIQIIQIKMHKFLSDQNKSFNEALKSYDFLKLESIMLTMRGWDSLMTHAKQQTFLYEKDHYILNGSLYFTDMAAELLKKVIEICNIMDKNPLNAELLKSYQDQKLIDEFYDDLEKKLKFLKQVIDTNTLGGYGENNNTAINKVGNWLKGFSQKLEQWGKLLFEELANNIDKIKMDSIIGQPDKILTQLGVRFQHLVALETKILRNNWSQNIEQALKKKINNIDAMNEKSRYSTKWSYAEKDSDWRKLADALIVLKNIAYYCGIEKLKKESNEKIDETLEVCIKGLGLKNLLQELCRCLLEDKSGMGQHVIDDHTRLKAYMVTMFEDATKAYGIDYVLRKYDLILLPKSPNDNMISAGTIYLYYVNNYIEFAAKRETINKENKSELKIDRQTINAEDLGTHYEPIKKILAVDMQPVLNGGNLFTPTLNKEQKEAIFHATAQNGYPDANLKGNNIAYESLSLCYSAFLSEYEDCLKENLMKDLDGLANKINDLKTKILKTDDYYGTTNSQRLVSLISNIFALWSLKGINDYYGNAETKKMGDIFYKKPHAGQVISIFRMLGIDHLTTKFKYGEKSFNNGLVQIGTGEGKSVILAVVASVLALMGYKVDCVCYSTYLSQRDWEEFEWLFNQIGIKDFVHYATFNQLSEKIINERGEIRTLVKNMIKEEKISQVQNVEKESSRPKILLIDEVDVFFNEDFYGNVYTPAADLQDETIEKLCDYIWEKREQVHRNELDFTTLETTTVYKQCCEKFKDWKELIQEAAKEMLSSVVSYQFKHPYIIDKNQIAYKDQDTISYNINYGYKTLFAYYHEYEAKHSDQHKVISLNTLKKHTKIQIHCGNFSYALLPKYKYVMGVTGTLKTLTHKDRGDMQKVIEETYNIDQYTYCPSVFGKNQLQMLKISVFSQDEYLQNIVTEIETRIEREVLKESKTTESNSNNPKCAILVVFKNKTELEDFYRSQVLKASKIIDPDSIQKLHEELYPDDRDSRIKKATMEGCITLMTRSFGRGTDFKCYSKRVIEAGGMHLIQTFLSEDLAEEIQIKGRVARQGKKGSYSMILREKDLLDVKTFAITKEELANNKSLTDLYRLLDKKRNAYFAKEYQRLQTKVLRSKNEHEKAMKFLEHLHAKGNKISEIKAFLIEQNKVKQPQAYSKTLLLMDATGSMSSLLENAKKTVTTMFQQATDILRKFNIPTNVFLMQCAVYRNYTSTAKEILQSSGWESNPNKLATFLGPIQASGGWVEEAIEIGLWHANSQADQKKLTQVILIGDAPANSKEQVIYKRKVSHTTHEELLKGEAYWRGEAYWKQFEDFKQETHYVDELKKLKQKNIKIHTFFVRPTTEDNMKNLANLKKNFEEIAKETNGYYGGELDINSNRGAEVLTKAVTLQVLSEIQQETGHGDELTKEYIKSYSK